MSILNLLGISTAIAAGAPATPATTATTSAPTTTNPAPAPQQSGSMLIWLPLLLLVIMYFMMIRPQQRRAKEQRKLIENLNKGDEVMTSAGIVGRIVKLADDFVILNVADGVDLTIQKNAIITILPKGTLKAV